MNFNTTKDHNYYLDELTIHAIDNQDNYCKL